MILLLLLLLFNSISCYPISYLNNTNFSNTYINLPTNGIIKEGYQYPFIGFGCSAINDNKNYLITSTYNPWKTSNNNYKCDKTTKYVEIMKQNFDNGDFEDNLIIGKQTSEYPDAQGDLGSDYIVTCGIDKKHDILYYVAANKYGCATIYNYDTAIVRINLKDFSFIDRTKFSSFTNKETFSPSSYYNYKYVDTPTTTLPLNDGTIWVGFGTVYTGLWRLNISSPNILLIEQFQKSYQEKYNDMISSSTTQQYYTDYIREIKKSFINKDTNLLYFLEDTPYRDSQLVEINTSIPIDHPNNTKIIKLDGINYISDIKIDYKRKRIFIVSGALTSELYQYDFNFNKLSLSDVCDIDFLKFPTAWGVITNIILDSNAGFIYAIPSTKHLNVGIARINIKDMSLDLDSFNKFGEIIYYTSSHNSYSYYRSYTNYNITSYDEKNGKLYIFPNERLYIKKYIKVELNGCNEGIGVKLNKCEICEIGKYSNEIGGICHNCEPGFSSNVLESRECTKCETGRYTNGIHAIVCINCPSGFFSTIQGSNICKACFKGKYSITTGSNDIQDCWDCDDGKISEEGKTTCETCEMGKWAKNKIECINCKKGKYSSILNIISEDSCQLCPKGKYSETRGITNINNCVTCDSGKFNTIEGADSGSFCIECDPGKYKKTLVLCENCPIGWVSGIKSNICTQCQMGKWAKNKKECVYCSQGKYSSSINIISDQNCKLCPIGKFSIELGLIDINECVECYSGAIGNIEGAKSNKSCIICEPGKYKKNLEECRTCPDGWVSLEKSNECVICPKGKYSNYYKIFCESCPLGRYNDIENVIGLDNCKICERGKFSNITSSITRNNCISCPQGKYNVNEGLQQAYECKNCDAGKYKNLNQNPGSECLNCDNGKYSYNGMNNCLTCEAGKYTNPDNELFIECDICPKGRYNKLEGKHEISSCIRCLAGKWNNNEGSITDKYCINCLPGLYSETIAATSRDECKFCIAGKFNDNYGANSASDCKDCNTGMYSQKGSIECISCQPGKYTSVVKSIICKDCEIGKYAFGNANIICKDCPIGSEQNYYKTECVCSKGTYKTNSTKLKCDTCPENFECPINSNVSTIIINKHLWRSNDTTIKTYKCKNIFACKGGKIINSTNDLCQSGHYGPLCDVCNKGWAKDDGVCLRCPENQGRSISLTIVIPVISTIIIIFLIKTANPAENKKEEVNGVVKIFMNYAQVFSLASSFQINWPSLIRYLFERAKEFSSPRVSFYSSDCVIGWTYYDKLLVYLTLPLLYIVIVTIIISILSCCFCKKKNKKLRRFESVIERNDFLKMTPSCFKFFVAWEKTAIVVGTFLSWPTILEKTLEVMNCQQIGNKYYLVKDVSIECYTTKHYNYLTISYISLGFYGIGIPLLGFKLLYDYRFRLFDMQNRYDGSSPLSFLFLGYREKRWYYEFIIMGKKASLIIISVFLRNYPRYQIIAASLMVQVSFFLHVFLRPYDVITSYGMICNKLESISLLSLVMTLSTGLFFGTIDSGYQLGTFEDVLIILLILCNGGITLYFFLYFWTLAYKTFRTHVHTYLNEKVDKEDLPCFMKCFSKKNIDKLFMWVENAQPNDYGINLKNDIEKKIFSNYFKEKQSKLEILNGKIDNIKKRRLSTKLDKLRSEIQVMEKERCWQTIKNNRLYNELRQLSDIDKHNLTDDEKKHLDDIFQLYIKHGIKYNKQLNNLYMKDLENMCDTIDEEKQNEIISTIIELRSSINEHEKRDTIIL